MLANYTSIKNIFLTLKTYTCPKYITKAYHQQINSDLIRNNEVARGRKSIL